MNFGELSQTCGTWLRSKQGANRQLLFCRVSSRGRNLLARGLFHKSGNKYNPFSYSIDVHSVSVSLALDRGPFSFTGCHRGFRERFGESWRTTKIVSRIISTSNYLSCSRARETLGQGAVNSVEKHCVCPGWRRSSFLSGSRAYCCTPKNAPPNNTKNLTRQEEIYRMKITSKREDSSVINARSSKKQKVLTPSVGYRVRIQQAAKRGTVEDAFDAFDEARREKVKLPAECFVTLLFLASGADDWEALVFQGDVNAEKSTPFLHRCDEVMEAMQESSYPPIEMCYTALARRDAILGKASAALDNALRVVDKGLGKKLRCFSPALATFAFQGDAKGAWKVYDSIIAVGLEPTEAEFSKVIQALGKGDIDDDISWGQVTALLRHMSKETTELKCNTIENIRNLFTSRRATKGLPVPNNEGVVSWQVGDCSVSENGFCDFCEDHLQAIDLSADEYIQFGSGIARLASKQERHPNDFKSVRLETRS